MNYTGWIIMLASVSGVTAFFGYNLTMVLFKEKNKHKLHSTLDETPDVTDEQ